MTHLIAFLALVVSAIFAFIMIHMSLSLTAAVGRVRRAGRQQAREFSRAGFTVGRFRTARVAKQDSSSMISTRAGMSLSSTSEGLVVKKTRTIAKDVF